MTKGRGMIDIVFDLPLPKDIPSASNEMFPIHPILSLMMPYSYYKYQMQQLPITPTL